MWKTSYPPANNDVVLEESFGTTSVTDALIGPVLATHNAEDCRTPQAGGLWKLAVLPGNLLL